MLRRFLAVLLLVLATAGAGAADKPSGITGLFLTTKYPALTVRAGETTTIDLSLRNFNLPPQQLALSVPQVASGWKATILGGGQPVESAIVAPDSEEKLQLRLEPPSGTGPGNYQFLVEAHGGGNALKLPISCHDRSGTARQAQAHHEFPGIAWHRHHLIQIQGYGRQRQRARCHNQFQRRCAEELPSHLYRGLWHPTADQHPD